MEQVIPDDESIKKVKDESPNASTTAKWGLTQAEAIKHLRKSRSQLGEERDSGA